MPPRCLVNLRQHAGLACTCLCLLAAWAAGEGCAGGLEVTPTTLSLPHQQAAGSLVLRNTGDAPLRAQIRTFRWTQNAQGDQLDPTEALLASPPWLRLEAGQEQVVRIIRATAHVSGVEEQAFRLIIDELPAPQNTGRRPGTSAVPGVAQLSFHMRYSLPVFIGDTLAPAAVAPQLVWRIESGPAGWLLQVHNPTPAHAQVADLSARLDDGSMRMLRGGLIGYVLAQQTMQWGVRVPADAGRIMHFEALINRETWVLDVRRP